MKCAEKPIGCGREFSYDEFLTWDYLTQRECDISGLCRKCQDVVFAEEDNPWPDDYDWNDEAPF